MPVIIAATAEQARDYAERLLAAATDPLDVQTDTGVDGHIGFRVSDELAAAAGFDTTADTAPEDAPPADGDAVPARNALREEWAEFLTRKHIEFPADATRKGLIDLWDETTAGTA